MEMNPTNTPRLFFVETKLKSGCNMNDRWIRRQTAAQMRKSIVQQFFLWVKRGTVILTCIYNCAIFRKRSVLKILGIVGNAKEIRGKEKVQEQTCRIGSVKWPMKKWAKTKRLNWTLKIADILVWGRCTPPLTARKRTAVGDSPTAKNSRTVRNPSVEYSSVVVLFACLQGQAESNAFGGWFITSGLESKNS